MIARIPNRRDRTTVLFGASLLALSVLTGAALPGVDDHRDGDSVSVTVRIEPRPPVDQPAPDVCAQSCDDGSLAATGGGQAISLAMLAGGLGAITAGLVAALRRGRRRHQG